MKTVYDIEFPPEWRTHPFRVAEILMTKDLSNGKAVLCGGILENGTNLMCLAYPEGQRMYRVSPDTGWAMEERFVGRPPRRERDRKIVNEGWRIAVEASIQAGREIEREGRER